MIPQARKKWLVRSQQYDGMGVEMVEVFSRTGLRQAVYERERREERGGAARVWGATPQPSPPLYIGVGGGCLGPSSKS